MTRKSWTKKSKILRTKFCVESNSKEELALVLQKLQELEFLILFTKLEVKMVEAKVDAVLLNQGAGKEALNEQTEKGWKQNYNTVFKEWASIKETIGEILKKGDPRNEAVLK